MREFWHCITWKRFLNGKRMPKCNDIVATNGTSTALTDQSPTHKILCNANDSNDIPIDDEIYQKNLAYI